MIETTIAPVVHAQKQTHKKEEAGFQEKHVLHELKHYLPSQTPLKDFIHHNTLHAFQKLTFFDAIFRASKIFGYQVTLQLTEFRELYSIGRIKADVLERIIAEAKGKQHLSEWKKNLLTKDYDASVVPRVGHVRGYWKSHYKIDLDNMVQPLLFRILCSYLDQGIALSRFPLNDQGFLSSIRELEKKSYTSFFKTRRAKELLQQPDCSMTSLLKIVVGNEDLYEQYIFDQQFTHQGWSGIISAIEDLPHSLLDQRKLALHDLIVFELLLEIDALDYNLGSNWEPLGNAIKQTPTPIFAETPLSELDEVFMLWQKAFEWSYYDEVLAGIRIEMGKTPAVIQDKTFQALFCIDERECSLRRHIESTDTACETFGTPGFFGVEFYFQPQHGQFYDKLCPAPVTPVYLIKEYDVKDKRKHEILYSGKTHTFLQGLLSTFTLGFFAGVRLVQNLFRPKMSPAISNAFAHMNAHGKLTIENKDVSDRENNLQVGFTVEEMTARVESVLRGIGLTKDFAPLVYLVAHGSSSANNPHHGAHDCGACSGRPGSVNSRVLAFMANHVKVRDLLAQRGLHIPEQTQFMGGLHDTAGDEIEFYDADILSAENLAKHRENLQSFEKALDLNAKERSRRFSSIKTKNSLKQVRKAILDRSVSMFEPRPELGHGTNTLCIVGSRDLTKGLFLDRRAFMNSYDYRTDPDGKMLTGIMKPLGPVCGGINLEYYFSRVDNYKLGAGTKLPHNVMGLIGVANSSDGDLRPGLPVQMIEVHDPVRLLIVVEHKPEIVLRTIQSVPEMYEWFINDWVQLIVIEPATKEFHYFKNGGFTIYDPLKKSVDKIEDMNSFIETAKEMETNYIVDATRENLPVYSIN